MTELKWWPTREADEVMPEHRNSPDDFILGRNADGFLFGRVAEHEDDENAYSETIKIGGITSFINCEDCGSVDVKFQPDGTYKALGPVPRGNSCWIPWDYDTLGDSLDDIAGYIKQGNLEIAAGGETHTVKFSKWSQEILMQLIAADNEKGCTFIPVKEGRA